LNSNATDLNGLAYYFKIKYTVRTYDAYIKLHKSTPATQNIDFHPFSHFFSSLYVKPPLDHDIQGFFSFSGDCHA
jgi:hypothetical protein